MDGANPIGDFFTQPEGNDDEAHTTTNSATDDEEAAAPPATTTTTSGDDKVVVGAEAPPHPADNEVATEPLVAPPEAPDNPFLPPEAPPADIPAVAQPEEVEEAPGRNYDPGADIPGWMPVHVNHLLEAVYGDWPHHNDGRHLTGRVEGDAAWQRRWRRIVDLSTTHYSAPKGKVGRRFISTLAKEFRGVQARTWNSERPLVFVAVVLQTTPGVKRARDIRKRLTHRMDLWDEGKFIALIDDTETEVQSRHGSHPVPTEETQARAYHERVLSGRLRSAVRKPDEPRPGWDTAAG